MSNINFDYKNLSPFKWFILENFPFLEADFDALTEWQLFCKIGKEINKIIDSQNIVGEQAETLTNAFNNLKNYVDNYFDNLDVQDEINQKLNEMALNGTLYNLMLPYLENIIQPQINEQNERINSINLKVNSAVDNSPLVASSISEMTDTSRVYVNTTDGHWYWYDGTSWQDGGTYQATGIADGSIDYNKLDSFLQSNVDSLFDISPNVFNKLESLLDKAVITWSTNITSSNYVYDTENALTSNPIPCNENEHYYAYRYSEKKQIQLTLNNIIFFNEDGTYNSKIEGQNGVPIYDFVIPSNCKYFAFTSMNGKQFNDTIVVTKNEYVGDFVGYGQIIPKFVSKEEYNSLQTNVNNSHIIFSFDEFAFDNRFTIMKQYNFPFTIALRGQTITREQYYQYFIDGNVDFSIYAGNGTIPEDYTQNQENWNNWVKSLCDEMKEKSGLFYPVLYSCANNKTSNILNNVCKQNGFKMCRAIDFVKDDGTIEWMNLTKGYLFDGIDDFNYVPLPIYESGFNLNTIKNEIDNAISQKKSIMLFTHLIKDEQDETLRTIDTSTQHFTAILDYIQSKVELGLCDVINARQYYNIYALNNDLDYKRTNLRNLFDLKNL